MNKSIITNLVEEMSLTVARNVKALRERAGLTQLDLALMLDTHKESISRMENGGTNLQLTSIIKLANLLEVDACKLLSEPMKASDFKLILIK